MELIFPCDTHKHTKEIDGDDSDVQFVESSPDTTRTRDWNSALHGRAKIKISIIMIVMIFF